MKVKSSVLLGLIVLVCLLGGLSLMSRLNVEEDMWRPVDMYSAVGGTHGSTFSTVSYDGAASSGVDMPMMPQSGSAFRRRAVSSYAHTGASASPSSIANGPSPIANSQGLYATSSAEHRSFGGGGNAAVSMSGGVVKSATSPVASTVTGVSTSGSVLSVGNLAQSSSSFNGDILSSMYASSGINTPYPAYAGISSATPGARGISGISGRKNGPMEGSMWAWLNNWIQDPDNEFFNTGDNAYGLDHYQLWEAYVAYLASIHGTGWSPDDMTESEKNQGFWQWLTWIQNAGDDGRQFGDNTIHWVPVGDYYPLIVFAMLFAGYLAIRRRKLQTK